MRKDESRLGGGSVLAGSGGVGAFRGRRGSHRLVERLLRSGGEMPPLADALATCTAEVSLASVHTGLCAAAARAAWCSCSGLLQHSIWRARRAQLPGAQRIVHHSSQEEHGAVPGLSTFSPHKRGVHHEGRLEAESSPAAPP